MYLPFYEPTSTPDPSRLNAAQSRHLFRYWFMESILHSQVRENQYGSMAEKHRVGAEREGTRGILLKDAYYQLKTSRRWVERV